MPHHEGPVVTMGIIASFKKVVKALEQMAHEALAKAEKNNPSPPPAPEDPADTFARMEEKIEQMEKENSSGGDKEGGKKS
jgi:phage shock protein A